MVTTCTNGGCRARSGPNGSPLGPRARSGPPLGPRARSGPQRLAAAARNRLAARTSALLGDAEAFDPAAVVGQFVLGFAREKVDQAALHALPLEQGALHLAGDRHL